MQPLREDNQAEASAELFVHIWWIPEVARCVTVKRGPLKVQPTIHGLLEVASWVGCSVASPQEEAGKTLFDA